jgi:hypothetical protein
LPSKGEREAYPEGLQEAILIGILKPQSVRVDRGIGQRVEQSLQINAEQLKPHPIAHLSQRRPAGRRLEFMKRLRSRALWIAVNIPLGRVSPHLLGFGLSARG